MRVRIKHSVLRLDALQMLGMLMLIVFAVATLQDISPQRRATQMVLHHTSDNAVGPLVHILSYVFPQTMVDRYGNIFAYQARADWANADAEIHLLDDDPLLGHVLAERYLHPSYTSSREELADWLGFYADHPQARRIHALALRKGAQAGQLARPASDVRLKGYQGAISGEDVQMPRHWKDGLYRWIKGDYLAAAQFFDTMGKHQQSNPWKASRAHFWAYRAYGKAGFPERARHHLVMASQAGNTSFYSMLARQLLSQSELDATIPEAIATSLLERDAVKRAALLSAIGRYDLVEEELRALYFQLARNEQLTLIDIAGRLNVPALQLTMAGRFRQRVNEPLSMRYPTPDWLAAHDYIIDPALIMAIARQESGFRADALSKAGAKGVMQLMPDTARYIINKHQLDVGMDELDDPTANITIAQHYIRYLNDKSYIGGNAIYLLAAYNAGPGNLHGWQTTFADEVAGDPLLFIEMIPFRETRHYVMKTLSNYFVYSLLLHGHNQLAAELSTGRWPNLHNVISSDEFAWVNK